MCQIEPSALRRSAPGHGRPCIPQPGAAGLPPESAMLTASVATGRAMSWHRHRFQSVSDGYRLADKFLEAEMRRREFIAGLGGAVAWPHIMKPPHRRQFLHSAAGAAAFALAIVLTLFLAPCCGTSEAASPLAVHVQNNRLVDASGNVLRLLGINRSGSEYMCVGGWSVFDGPVDSTAIAAIKAWHVNAVRVPLNEDCWLNINLSSTMRGSM
jgi:hypothetical protein